MRGAMRVAVPRKSTCFRLALLCNVSIALHVRAQLARAPLRAHFGAASDPRRGAHTGGGHPRGGALELLLAGRKHRRGEKREEEGPRARTWWRLYFPALSHARARSVATTHSHSHAAPRYSGVCITPRCAGSREASAPSRAPSLPPLHPATRPSSSSAPALATAGVPTTGTRIAGPWPSASDTDS